MTWYDGFQVWLSESESLSNAQKIIDYFYNSSDWSKESLSAMIGNMRHESSVNPNMYEYGYDWEDDRGYGLVQWTPRSKFWDWATGEGLDPEIAESQLARIDYEVENNIQYLANGHQVRYGNGDKYDFSFSDFRTNAPNLNVDQLTEAFMWNYEGPSYQAGVDSLQERQAFSNRVYNELTWEGGEDTGDINKVINNVITIVNSGESSIVNEIENLFQNTDLPLEDLLKDLVKPYLYKNSKSYYSNNYIKATLVKNLIKLNVTGNFDGDIGNVLETLFNNVDGVITDEFSNMKTQIENLRESDPTPTGDIFFPVDFNRSGINFWYPPYNDDLTANMDFGTRTNGDFHSGYDIGGGGSNHPVYATTSGTVTRANTGTGIGYVITIDHSTDEYHSLYGHLTSNLLVSEGDTVQAGQQIGTMGDTGGNYAIHLHYELSTDGTFFDNGNVIDPKPYLKITGDNQTDLKNPN